MSVSAISKSPPTIGCTERVLSASAQREKGESANCALRCAFWQASDIRYNLARDWRRFLLWTKCTYLPKWEIRVARITIATPKGTKELNINLPKRVYILDLNEKNGRGRYLFRALPRKH